MQCRLDQVAQMNGSAGWFLGMIRSHLLSHLNMAQQATLYMIGDLLDAAEVLTRIAL